MRYARLDAIFGSKGVIAVLSGVFVIAADVVLTFAVLKPQAAEIRVLQEKFSGLKKGPAAAKAISDFEKTLPDGKGLARVISSLFTAARASGLTVTSGDYRPETAREADISRYTVQFPVEGSYSQIKRFIYSLENIAASAVIEEIVLSRSRAAEGTIEVRIRITVYYKG
jgi:Tfp pilus assembly protein PilO